MRDTAIEMAKRLLADSIWKSNNLMLLREYNRIIVSEESGVKKKHLTPD